MENKTYEMNLLLDFFGELLSDRQRECLSLYYDDDLSLAEIAEIAGISRQGVRDNIVRATESLHFFEEKTGLVRRFLKTRDVVERIETQLAELSGHADERGRELIAGIAETVGDLKY